MTRREYRARAAALLALVLVPGALGGQDSGNAATTVILRSGRIDLTPASERASRRSLLPAGDEPPQLFLVSLAAGGTGRAFRSDVLAGGGHVVGYIPDETVMVWGPPGPMEDVASKHGANMAAFPASHKAPGELRREVEAAGARARDRKRAGLASRSSSAAQAANRNLWQDPDLAGYQTWLPATRSGAPSGRKLKEDDGPRLYGIQIQIVPALLPEALLDIEKQWPDLLASALGRTGASEPCRPKTEDMDLPHAKGSAWLRVYLCAEDLSSGLQWLLDQAETMWAEPLYRIVGDNARAEWILQTGALTRERQNNPLTHNRPYWRAGLMGNREIVHVVDTGLDLAHCHFVDDAFNPVTLYNASLASVSTLPDWRATNHRKIVYYVAANGNLYYGDESGHGTHVTGSVLGAIGNGDNKFSLDLGTGSAPMARASVMDAGVRFNFI
ncbi:hypothetical protein HYH03_001429 [Edaphochlamys debaryana]|uniref:Peptidase S8/S53 domain-containing protein n=1 Tax=Edaphochlamys debaryana TaxID=47281 RepID=A0A835YGA0_9CHLO|nr:hypothetical protein HYH03_001429 [Edaphochlamys debaryana]|eukprot:KAG2500663.1 hypothetical protein HYH03_001429 [Edaphochlamys debaryana]